MESHQVLVNLITIEKIVEYDDRQHNHVDYDDQNDSNMRLDDQVLHESLLIPRGRAALLLFWSLSSSWSFYFYFYVHFIAVVQKILQLKLVLEYLLQILDVSCGCLRGISISNRSLKTMRC